MNLISCPLFSKATQRLFFGVLAAGAFAVSGAIAQTQPGNTLPEALKDIKQATGMCVSDDGAPGRTGAGGNGANPDMSCVITPADLSALLARGDSVPVDVRHAADYEVFRIDGALNVSVSELRTKPFLQGKTIVLIGNGKAERELYVACAELKTQGFKQVKVLRGGMPSWLLHGQAVVGRAADATLPVRVSTSDLWTESQFDANLVLVARSQTEIQRQLPVSVLVQDESPGAVKVVIERRRKELRNAPLAAVVLVTSPRTSVETLQRLRQAIQPVPLLVYTDGPESYAKQLVQQKAVWVAQQRGPRRPGCGL